MPEPLAGVRYAAQPGTSERGAQVLQELLERAGVAPGQATIVNGTQAVVYLWYDNEFGYSCQVYRILEQMAGIQYRVYPEEG